MPLVRFGLNRTLTAAGLCGHVAGTAAVAGLRMRNDFPSFRAIVIKRFARSSSKGRAALDRRR
jgi:hypothetical protein